MSLAQFSLLLTKKGVFVCPKKVYPLSYQEYTPLSEKVFLKYTCCSLLEDETDKTRRTVVLFRTSPKRKTHNVSIFFFTYAFKNTAKQEARSPFCIRRYSIGCIRSVHYRLEIVTLKVWLAASGRCLSFD